MPRPGFASVDEYIAAQPDASQPILELVRATIRKALPKAEETISYQIPAYKMPGGWVVYFAGFKRHYSVYPVTPPVVEAFRDELEPYEVNNKGTVRFALDKPVPTKLIARIAKFRAKQVAEAAKAKAAAKKL